MKKFISNLIYTKREQERDGAKWQFQKEYKDNLETLINLYKVGSNDKEWITVLKAKCRQTLILAELTCGFKPQEIGYKKEHDKYLMISRI